MFSFHNTMQRLKDIEDKLVNLKTQVCILDNGRTGSYYAAVRTTIKNSNTDETDAIQKALDESNGIPTPIFLILQDAFKTGSTVIESKETPPIDLIPRLISPGILFGKVAMENIRLVIVPLGISTRISSLTQELLHQVYDDMRHFPMVYYNYHNQPTPQLQRLGTLALPNPERYCEFSPGEVFSAEEEKMIMYDRTKALFCVSHGRPINTKFTVKMVDLVPGSTPSHVKYLKQTGEMVDLPIAAFEQKMAKVRGISHFSFTDRLRISAAQDDFNEDRLPAPAWQFSFGYPFALSTQHNFHSLYNPKHLILTKGRCIHIKDKKELTPSTPPVYFARIGALGSYGVFAATELKPNTFLGIYAGDLTDSHPNPLAKMYSYLLRIPGYLYSNNQAIYAFDSGNMPTLINSAPMPSASNQHSPLATANIAVYPAIYKKTPLVAYYTAPGKSIPKGAQLFIDYEDLLKSECSRHFSFFKKGTSLYATDNFVEYSKADQAKGREHFKSKNYVAAKDVLKTAYHLAKAYYDQSSPQKAAPFCLIFASICEDLGDIYNHLANPAKAKAFFQQAIDLRKTKTSSDPQRIKKIEEKLQTLDSTIKLKK